MCLCTVCAWGCGQHMLGGVDSVCLGLCTACSAGRCRYVTACRGCRCEVLRRDGPPGLALYCCLHCTAACTVPLSHTGLTLSPLGSASAAPTLAFCCPSRHFRSLIFSALSSHSSLSLSCPTGAFQTLGAVGQWSCW